VANKLELIIEPGKRHFDFRRVFDAPAHLVWEAMTKPEHVARWYGPRKTKVVACEMDFRVGGKWKTVLRMPEGGDAEFSGEFLEIDPQKKVKQTWRFGMFPEAESVEEIIFEPQGNKTVVRGTVTHITVENRDGHLGSGMEGGMIETYERLDEVLAELAR
jgi:uncharacterized protein YndB with AHSA1/START domain